MAGKPAYTEEELESLTDEERAGLEDPDLIDDPIEDGDDTDDSAAAQIEAQRLADEQAATAAAAAEAAKAKAEPDAEAIAKAAADKAATDKAAADAEAAKVAAAAAAGAETGATTEPPKPIVATAAPQWTPPADAKQKLDAIEAKKDEITARFDDGEMTAPEYRAALKPLDAEERQIRDDVFKATIAQDMNKDSYFQVTVPNFMGQHPEYAAGSPLYAALDSEVRQLQAKAANPFDPQILEDAHNAVREKTLKALGIDPATVTTGKKAAPEPAEKREIPPTLANVPSADITETGAISKFAYLDKLSGTAYEAALEKLSDAERDQYLQEG